jgi:polygalacturonase
MIDRRDFVKSVIAGGAGVLVVPRLGSASSLSSWADPVLPVDASADDPWIGATRILARIKPPVFPNRDFRIIDHGAVADGSTDATAAIRKAIEACHAAGGGRVVVPPGVFITGAIHLQSNVNLFLSEGATLKFSSDPAMYLPAVFTRFEGTECMNFSPLIYAFEQENIAITGTGVLDGSASDENWWKWARRPAPNTDPPARPDIRRLLDFGERGVPVAQRVFGAQHLLRPSFIQPYRCRNVLIEGISIRNSPMWEIHPVLSTNVTVRGVKISTHGPNNDG